jgi:hypothetical protein
MSAQVSSDDPPEQHQQQEHRQSCAERDHQPSVRYPALMAHLAFAVALKIEAHGRGPFVLAGTGVIGNHHMNSGNSFVPKIILGIF